MKWIMGMGILNILIVALLFPLRSRMTAEAVVVAGSTSVQPYAEILAEEYAVLFDGARVDVQGGGSSAGITAVESGAADIGMSSRALKKEESHLWSAEIAKDGLAVIVHPENPVNGLTLAQVRAVYDGTALNWLDIGGLDAEIHVITREDGSGTRGAFEELAMEGRFIKPSAIVQDSNGAVRQIVSGDRNAIGFISLGITDDTVKAVNLNGIAATPENVLNGTYSLYRPFLFVAKEEPDGEAGAFIDFIFSRDGRALLENEGLVTD